MEKRFSLQRQGIMGAVLLLLAQLLLPGVGALAGVTGASFVVGSGSVVVTGNDTNINANTMTTLMRATGLNISSIERLFINQASSARFVALVTGGASSIAGPLFSNGNVVIVNPAGIAFLAGASVNTAGFFATTAAFTQTQLSNWLLNPGTSPLTLPPGAVAHPITGLANIAGPPLIDYSALAPGLVAPGTAAGFGPPLPGLLPFPTQAPPPPSGGYPPPPSGTTPPRGSTPPPSGSTPPPTYTRYFTNYSTTSLAASPASFSGSMNFSRPGSFSGPMGPGSFTGPMGPGSFTGPMGPGTPGQGFGPGPNRGPGGPGSSGPGPNMGPGGPGNYSGGNYQGGPQGMPPGASGNGNSMTLPAGSALPPGMTPPPGTTITTNPNGSTTYTAPAGSVGPGPKMGPGAPGSSGPGPNMGPGTPGQGFGPSQGPGSQGFNPPPGFTTDKSGTSGTFKAPDGSTGTWTRNSDGSGSATVGGKTQTFTPGQRPSGGEQGQPTQGPNASNPSQPGAAPEQPNAQLGQPGQNPLQPKDDGSKKDNQQAPAQVQPGNGENLPQAPK